MPVYAWSCLACGQSNPAQGTSCGHCGCPAQATYRQIEAARRALGPTESTAASEAEASNGKVLAFVLAMAVAAFGAFVPRYAPSLGQRGLGLLLVFASVSVLVRLR
jgi:hypothetical protein